MRLRTMKQRMGKLLFTYTELSVTIEESQEIGIEKPVIYAKENPKMIRYSKGNEEAVNHCG